jgi:hypothetical protein
MTLQNLWLYRLLAGCLLLLSAAHSTAQQKASPSAEQTLDEAAEQEKFAFVLFHNGKDPRTQSMAKALRDGLANRSEASALVQVLATDPQNAELVERFGVSRAPLPIAFAVAPNGAITGVFHRQITAESLEEAFVTPTMTRCMKSLQDGKLVLVCVRSSARTAIPQAVEAFQADEHFRDRIKVESFLVADAAEQKFLKQMELDPATVKTATTILLAPPGVLVGKFAADASMDSIAAELAKAGKCCDDPKCKHHQSAGPPTTSAAKPAPSGATKRRQ